jgi:hypothetical protein
MVKRSKYEKYFTISKEYAVCRLDKSDGNKCDYKYDRSKDDGTKSWRGHLEHHHETEFNELKASEKAEAEHKEAELAKKKSNQPSLKSFLSTGESVSTKAPIKDAEKTPKTKMIDEHFSKLSLNFSIPN